MRRILPLAALGLLALAAVAFWPPYLSRLPAARPLTHLHAALGTAWLLLLATQPLLLIWRRRQGHRMLGRVGVVVGLAFVGVSVLMAHQGLTLMTPEQLAREGRFVYLPLAMTLVFASALVQAVRWRGNVPLHARYMAATMLSLLDPVFARLLYAHGPALPHETLFQLPAFTVALVALLAMSRSLPAGSRERAGMLRFATAVGVLLLGFYVVPRLDAWQRAVEAFRLLPLP